jgi:hypothetical protein
MGYEVWGAKRLYASISAGIGEITWQTNCLTTPHAPQDGVYDRMIDGS